ncbi:MAG: response regulator [Thermodesulfobacteriota bacterium]|nr:response regulator [Thermodesulfobacteriota bacterium]
MIDIHSMKVLIVDDMENMVKSVRAMMKVLGYGKEFRYANNGREAWNLLQRESIDLAIIDWNMPVMNGVELLSRIREDRELRDLPIVMVTAEANRGIVAEAAETDIDAYILKPLTVKSLGDKLQKVVEKANNPPPMIYHLKEAKRLEDGDDLAGALKEALRAAEVDPSSSRPLREIGYFYAKQGKLKEAEKCLLRAVGMNDIDAVALHRLGDLYTRMDDIDNAMKYYDKAMAVSPRHVTRAISFGKILVQKKVYDKARKVFENAFTITDNPAILREDVAGFCMNEGFYDYAATLYDTLLRKDPERNDLLINAGICLMKNNDHEKAVGYLSEADRLDKENQETKMLLAKNYLTLNKGIRAERYLKEVLKLQPENQEAKEMLREIV